MLIRPFLYLVSFILSINSVNCGVKKNANSNKIIDGTKADASEYNFIVSFKLKTFSDHSFRGCAGTLIHLKWVLTSKFCSEHNDGNVYIERSGNIVHNVLIDKNFSLPNIDNKTVDLVLIHLKEPINYPQTTTIHLAKQSLDAGKKLTVLGWGWKHFPSPKQERFLLKSEIAIRNRNECKHSNHNSLMGSFCADGKACVGDYGNPLIYTGDLFDVNRLAGFVGMNSITKHCAGSTAMYVNVAHYRLWIRAILCLHGDMLPDSFCN